MLALDWFDLLLILFAALAVVIGLTQGLVREVIGLAALYLGSVVGAQYYYFLASPMRDLMPTTPPLLVNSIAFFIILIAVVLILAFLAQDAGGMMFVLNPTVDRLGGLFLGLISAGIFVTMMVNVLTVATGVGWAEADAFRETLQDALGNSLIAHATSFVLPSLLGAIRPWLPVGLPSIFSVS